MKPPNSAILMLALVSLALGSTLFAQDATPAGPTVELSMIVTDSAKKSIDKIQKEDVHVIEDKVEQKVLSLERDKRPVDLVLAIDSSNSLRSSMPKVLEAARVVIVNRRPDDEILVMRFIGSDVMESVRNFTGDGDELIRAVNRIRTDRGQSAVIDALYIASENMFTHFQKRSKERRQAVLIVTDGEDRNSFYKQDALIKMLRQSDVQIFALGLVTDLDTESRLVQRSPKEKAEKLLQTVTSVTGGRVFFPRDTTELIDSISQIIADLHGQFRLRYQSPNGEKKGPHKVEVKIDSPAGEKRNAIVRPGYDNKLF